MCIERSNGFPEPQQCNDFLSKANDHNNVRFSWLIFVVLNFSFHSSCFRPSVTSSNWEDDKKS